MSMRQRAGVPLGVGTQLTYMPALDGIRAVSILGIMANHGGFGWAAGGVISVNVFFVLSGFLITMLLMKEWTRSGTIRLRAFWARRARRLLPALFVLLGAIGLYALFFAPSGTQGPLRADGLSTLFYFSNWHQIIAGQSYFAQVSAPSPLLHTWTLAIEEQFYLVWPIVVICVLKLYAFAPGPLRGGRTRRARLGDRDGAPVPPRRRSEPDLLRNRHPGPGHPDRRRAGDPALPTAAGDRAGGPGPGSRRWRWRPPPSSSGSGPGSTAPPDLTYQGGFLVADLMVGAGDLRGHPGSVRPARSGPVISTVDLHRPDLLWPVPVALADIPGPRRGAGPGSRATACSPCASRSPSASPSSPGTWWRRRFVRRNSAAGDRGPGFRSVRSPWPASCSSPRSGSAAAVNVLVPPKNLQKQVAAYLYDGFAKQGSKSRVLVVGDSVSLTVGFWMSPYASQYGMVIRGRPLDGCGLVTALPFDFHGTVTPGTLAPCTQWPSIWQSDVAQLHPQVVALVIGWWEAMDRVYQGTWQHLGDPAIRRLRAGTAGEGGHRPQLDRRPGGADDLAVLRQR